MGWVAMMRRALLSLQKTWWSLMSAGETCCPISQGQGLRAFLCFSEAELWRRTVVTCELTMIAVESWNTGERNLFLTWARPGKGCGAHREAAAVTVPSARASGWCPDARSQPGGSTSSGRCAWEGHMPFQEENEDIRGPQITKEYCLRRAFRKSLRTLYKLCSVGFCLSS